jgi:hypothetical protein
MIFIVFISYFFQTVKNKNLEKSILWDYTKIRNILAVPKVTGSNPVGCTTCKATISHKITLLTYSVYLLLYASFYQNIALLLKKIPKFFLNRLGVSYGW